MVEREMVVIVIGDVQNHNAAHVEKNSMKFSAVSIHSKIKFATSNLRLKTKMLAVDNSRVR